MADSIRDAPYLAVKAALACLVTLLLDRAIGNPDHVSSTFVAVLCVSPLLIVGLRQGLSQLAGSALGGVWGTLASLTNTFENWGIVGFDGVSPSSPPWHLRHRRLKDSCPRWAAGLSTGTENPGVSGSGSVASSSDRRRNG